MANLPGIDTVIDDFLSNQDDNPWITEVIPEPDTGGWRTTVTPEPRTGVTIDTTPDPGLADEIDREEREILEQERLRERERPPLSYDDIERDYLSVMGLGRGRVDDPPPSPDPVEHDIQNILSSVGIRYEPDITAGGPGLRQRAERAEQRDAFRETQDAGDRGVEGAVSEEALGQHNLLMRLMQALRPHAEALTAGSERFRDTGRLEFSTEEIEEAINIFSNPATFTGARGARRLASHVASHGNSQEVRAALRAVSSIHDYARAAERTGVSDAEIIAEANRRLAATSARLPGSGSIQDVFGGLSRGVDGQWRVELNDQSGRLIGSVAGLFEGRWRRSNSNTVDAPSLQDVLHHNALFMMYPELRGIRVTFNRQQPTLLNTAEASFGMGPDGNPVITVSAPTETSARSALYHEIQHVIQDIEGFAGGGSPRRYFSIAQSGDLGRATQQLEMFGRTSALGLLARGDLDTARRLIDTLPPWIKPQAERILVQEARHHFRGTPWQFEGRTLQELSEFLQANPAAARPLSLLSIADRADMEIYRSIVGEVESRTVQRRLDYSAEDRRRRPPAVDMRTPERQILAPRESIRLDPVQSIEGIRDSGVRTFNRPLSYEHIRSVEPTAEEITRVSEGFPRAFPLINRGNPTLRRLHSSVHAEPGLYDALMQEVRNTTPETFSTLYQRIRDRANEFDVTIGIPASRLFVQSLLAEARRGRYTLTE